MVQQPVQHREVMNELVQAAFKVLAALPTVAAVVKVLQLLEAVELLESILRVPSGVQLLCIISRFGDSIFMEQAANTLKQLGT